MIEKSLILFTTLVILILIGCTDSREIIYYENGKKQYEYTTIDGKQNGEAIKYYEDGRLMQRSNWLDNKKEGKTVLYHRNGKKKLEADFEN